MKKTLKEKETLVFLGIVIAFSIFLFSTIDETGVTHDEVAYFQQTIDITNTSIGFFEKFKSFTPPYHGAFMELFSVPFYLVTKSFLSTTTSLRIGTSVMYVLFLFFVFFFVRKKFGRMTALITAIIMMGMPRLFFHSHLLALEFPIMVLYFTASLLFYEAYTQRSVKYAILTSATLGAILATKITGYIIFIVFLIYTVYYDITTKKATTLRIKKRNIHVLLFIFLFSGLLYLIVSPSLYKNPFSVTEYLKYHSPTARWDKVFLFNASHEPSSPISFLHVPVTLITTFNALHVFLAILGLFLISKKTNSIGTYIGTVFLLTLIFFMSPLGYKGDGHGERYFLMLYPFLALFAGISAQTIVKAITTKAIKKRYIKVVDYIAIAILIATSAYTLAYAYPFESSYFNSIIGGTATVAKYNLMTVTYWSDELLYTLDWLNENLPANASIEAPPQVSPYRWYQSQGMLRKDIQIDINNPQYLIVTLRQSSFFPEWLWNAEELELAEPIFVVKNKQGVELVRVFNITDLEVLQYELFPFIAWPFKAYEEPYLL